MKQWINVKPHYAQAQAPCLSAKVSFTRIEVVTITQCQPRYFLLAPTYYLVIGFKALHFFCYLSLIGCCSSLFLISGDPPGHLWALQLREIDAAWAVCERLVGTAAAIFSRHCRNQGSGNGAPRQTGHCSVWGLILAYKQKRIWKKGIHFWVVALQEGISYSGLGQNVLKKKENYFLGFSSVVAGLCYWPWSRCILAEYNLALSKYEGYLVSKFP